MTQKQTRLETILAEEILAEAARKGLKHNVIQRESGVLPRAWGRYFVQRERTIPLDVVTDVARVLGLPASTLLRRAEDRFAEESGPLPKLTAEMRDELSERLAADLNDPEVDAARAAFFAEQERKRRSR